MPSSPSISPDDRFGPSIAGVNSVSFSLADTDDTGSNDSISYKPLFPVIPSNPPFLFGLPQRQTSRRKCHRQTPLPQCDHVSLHGNILSPSAESSNTGSLSLPDIPEDECSISQDDLDKPECVDPYDKISTSNLFDHDLIDLAQGHVPGDLPTGSDKLPPPCSCCEKPLGSCPEFINSHVELVHQIFQTGQANQDGLRIPLRQPFLRPSLWANLLGSYWDRVPILEGLHFGWDIGLVGSPTPISASRNHPSAVEFSDDVRHYIKTELAYGCILGPLSRRKLPFPVSVCPLGAVPKQLSLRRRIITDCTFSGKGINNWIPKRWYRGRYWKIDLPTVDSIIALIKRVREQYPGEIVVGFKMDLSRYFRYLLVDPGQSPYLALQAEHQLFLDLVFSYGNRGAMVAAQRLSDGLCWIYRTKVPPSPGAVNSGQDCSCPGPCSCGSNSMVDYVDDFISICPQSHAEHLWKSFSDLLQQLGLKPSLTPGHLVPPSTTFVGLGILFNLDDNTISVPSEKLAATRELILLWLHKLEASKQELQSLLGKLLHVCRVVRSGRLLLSRMLETYRRCIQAGGMVRLDNEFVLDLRWWHENLEGWNGISFLEFKDFDNKVALDASTNGALDSGPGLGGFNFMRNEWFKCGVPDRCRNWHIADLELLCHLVAIRLWGSTWTGLKIYGLTDSEPCELLLRHGRSRVNLRLSMARAISSLEHRFNFQWVSGPIRSKDNVLPDCASRWRDPERRNTFWQTCRELDICPAERSVPDEYFHF